ncbi:hypothetical protein Nepgr_030822 [Nepenthes gracilis]|uniref:Legume lectin domain-containing protein n=1 Tax=Nepenthes gracilis TaxID=150966 RepID=A0AAD3Y6F6_NEPGR|nr:hypothetical protein Nepgr_030822 [Nepenthes gracilis]
MASYSIFRYIFSLSSLLLFFANTLFAADPTLSVGFQNHNKNSSRFQSQIALYGDAKLHSDDFFIQITGPGSFSAGRIIYRKPIKLLEGNPRRKVSFGTYFSFSLSPEDGDGLAFVMLPNGFASSGYDGSSMGLAYEMGEKKIKTFAVEFDTKMDAMYGDLNGNHVGIDVGSLVSVRAFNLSSNKLVLNSDEKFHCWIDYEASSMRIEVRLSKLISKRPIDPLLWCPIDLSEIFQNEQVFVGLVSSNANSTQICRVYSWSFKLRHVPYWMHSQPLDPEAFTKDTEPVTMVNKRSHCILRVLTALILGTGCGALGASLVLWVWTIFAHRRPVMPDDCAEHPVKCNFHKVEVLVVHMDLKDGRE